LNGRVSFDIHHQASVQIKRTVLLIVRSLKC